MKDKPPVMKDVICHEGHIVCHEDHVIDHEGHIICNVGTFFETFRSAMPGWLQDLRPTAPKDGTPQ
jgi:hypothetical protein